MGITIKLFSSLREVLGESEFEFALTELDSTATVAAVKSALSQRGATWQEALNQPNLVHALNHKVSTLTRWWWLGMSLRFSAYDGRIA